MEQREEREEYFCRVYGKMETEDKEKVALTAKKLLFVQEAIKNENCLDIEGEGVPV